MAMSDALRQEVAAMAKIEQVLSALPDRSRYRVTGWVLDNFTEPAEHGDPVMRRERDGNYTAGG